MKKTALLALFASLGLASAQTPATSATAPNTLTPSEKEAGWKLLWDGKTSDGWRSSKSDVFPASGWSIKDGILTTHENGGKESVGAGDIITRERYKSFELSVDFKITPGANSGIKFYVQPGLAPISSDGKKAAVGSAIGIEFQILDDQRHPDAKLGKDGNRTIGSLYDLITAPAEKKVNPPGEWNTARILAQGNKVQFWLNGEKIIAFERASEDFRARVAASKYNAIPSFGEWEDGHILLKEHGNEVSFRNVKIRPIP